MRDDLEEVKRSVEEPSRHADVNAVVGGYLRDLAFAQPSQPKMFGYKRAAAAVLALETPLTELVADDGTLPRIAGIGPGSTRVIREVLETGGSPTVDAAVAGSERRTDIERRRSLAPTLPEPRRGAADPARSSLWRPLPGPLSRRSADALGMERWQPQPRRDCEGLCGAGIRVRGGDRSLLRPQDRRRNVDG